MNATKKTINPWVYSILALVLIASVTTWIVMKHDPAALRSLSGPTPSPTVNAYDPRTETPNQVFNLVATTQKLVSGPSDIVVSKGDSVRINITAQGKDEIHARLDGYDVETESHPTDSTPGGFSFIADKVGEFAYYVSGDATGSTPITYTRIGKVTVK